MVASPKLMEKEFSDLVNQHVLTVPLIINEKDCFYRTSLEQYLRDKGISCSQKIEIWSIESIKRMVMSGIGISLLPETCFRKEIESGELKVIVN